MSPSRLPTAREATSPTLGGLSRFASTNMIGRIAGRGLGLASFVLLARLGGEQTFGWIVLVFAWCSIAGMFAAMGLEWPVLRFTKLHLDAGRADLARGLTRLAEAVPLVVGSLIGVLVIVALKLGSSIGGSWSELAWFIPVVPLAAYLLVRRNLMLSLERPVLALVPVNIIRPLAMLAIMLPLAAAAGWQLSYTAAAASMSMSFVVAAVWARLAARSDIRGLLGTGASVRQTRSWTGIGLAMVLVTGGFLVLNQIDTLLLGAMTTLSDVAAYNAGYRIVSLMAMPLIAIQSATASRLSAAHTQDRIDDLHAITQWVSRLALFATGIIFLGLLFAGNSILSIFGDHFTNARLPMLILAGAYLFSSWMGPTGYVMNMTNRQYYLAVIILIACMLNVVGNLMLIPIWGMTGAATSTAVTIVAWNIAVIALLRRSTGRWMLWIPAWLATGTTTSDGIDEATTALPTPAETIIRETGHIDHVLIIDPIGSGRSRSALLIQSLQAAGASVHAVTAPRGLRRSYFALRRAISNTNRADFAVCFAHGPRAVAAWAAWRTTRRSPFTIYLGGDPAALDHHELTPDGTSLSRSAWSQLRLWLNLHATRMVLRRADGVICVSEYLATTVRKRLATKGRTCVMPPCTQTVPKTFLHPPTAARGDIIRKVLTVTNFNFRAKRDGVLAIVRGLNAFCGMSDDNIEYSIAGSGAFLPDLTTAINRMDIHRNLRINLLGHVTDVATLFEISDVFAYSSTNDAYPNVIVEAMSFGLPLIVNDHPLFDEFLGTDQHAARFNPESPNSFANALQWLATSRECRYAMIAANLELVRNSRSRTAVGEHVLLFLHSLQSDTDDAV